VGCKAVLQKVYASHLAEEALLLAATTQDARAMAQAETQLAECKAAEAQAQDILEQLENRMDAAQLGYDSTANRMNPSVSMLADFGQATRNHETERNEAQREALREIEERLHYVDARWQVEQRYGVALLESQREVAHLQGKNVNLEREFSGWREQAAQITSCINKLIPQEEPKKETEDTEPQKSVPKKKTDDPAFKHYKAAVQEAFARGHPHISKKQLEQLMRQAFQELSEVQREHYLNESSTKTPKHKQPKEPPHVDGKKLAIDFYCEFSQKVLTKQLRKGNPDITDGEVTKTMKKLWKALSEEEKKPFEDEAAAWNMGKGL